METDDMNAVIDNPFPPCCPALEKDDVCDVLDFHYRQTHTTTVVTGGRRVLVEVLIHARFERCPGPMTLGARRSGLHHDAAAWREGAPVHLGSAHALLVRQRQQGQLSP
jgi:hypothetical protein